MALLWERCCARDATRHRERGRLLGLSLLLALAAAACPGSSREVPQPPDQGAPPPDQGSVVSPDTGPPPAPLPGCSAAGIAAGCDPLSNTGCGEGACYVLKDQGSACLCPEGAVASGQDCNSSTECAPQQACAGTTPPGKCRPLCDPNSPSCPADTPRCVPITNHTQWGICKLPE